MLTDKEIIEKYSKTSISKELKSRLERIGCTEDLIADTLSDLATDEKMQKMIDVLNHGVTTENDINYACVAIERGDEIEYDV